MSDKEVTSYKRACILFGRICLTVLIAVGIVVAPLAEKRANSAPKVIFPKKKITWIVTYGPGGGYDTYSRAIARVLPKYLPKKVSIVVRNIPGAGGMTGTIALFRSKPDGHTMGMVSLQGMAVITAMGKKGVDPTKFTYLGAVVRDPGSILVAANSPFRSLEDLQRAQKVKFGATGPPSTSWIAPKLAKPILKIPVEIVTGYSGSTGYITGLIRGDVDAAYISVGAGLSYVKAGEIRPIINFRHSELQPGVPAIQEGTPYEEMRLVGEDRVVAAPPGVPQDIANILEGALLKSMNDPETQAWSKKTGKLFTPLSGKEVSELTVKLTNTYKKYSDILK
jgi:tripartite-type tricarboxylate transporter receptor subunit TctC